MAFAHATGMDSVNGRRVMAAAAAQSYPGKSLRMIVPFPAGRGTGMTLNPS